MRPFSLHRPTGTREASELLVEYGDEAAFYCGGTELLAIAKMGLARASHLVDLKRIPELRGIERSDGMLRIGAAVTHREIETSATVLEAAPTMAAMERDIANIRVRHTGTLGGNVCFAEPHSDPTTFLAAWGAEVELQAIEARRRLSIDRFVLGAFETARRPEEVLVAIWLPDLPHRSTVSHRKIRFNEYPAATVACRLTSRDDCLWNCRVVVGSVGDIPTEVTSAGALLEGTRLEDAPAALQEAARLAARDCEPNEDLNGSVEYKRALVEVLVRRAAQAALADISGH